MTQHGTPPHGAHHSTAPDAVHAEPLPFTDAQWQAFREEDKTAGTYIVSLVVGIFLVGLVLYIGVLISVLSRAPA